MCAFKDCHKRHCRFLAPLPQGHSLRGKAVARVYGHSKCPTETHMGRNWGILPTTTKSLKADSPAPDDWRPCQHPDCSFLRPLCQNQDAKLFPNSSFKKCFYWFEREREKKRERGEGREGEKHGWKRTIDDLPPACPTGDWIRNPGTCPDGESNQQPLGAQPTEPHQSRQIETDRWCLLF